MSCLDINSPTRTHYHHKSPDLIVKEQYNRTCMSEVEELDANSEPIEAEAPAAEGEGEGEMDEQCQQEQEEEYYYNDDYYDVDNLALQASHSKDQPYSIYQLDELIKKIWEEIAQKATLCFMSDGWTLMLYSFTNFNSNYFDDLIDQDNTGRNIIKYDQEYQNPGFSVGECAVCLTESELLSNPCGHSFCRECWRIHIGMSLNDRNVYELFPLCQEDGCYYRTNYHLMSALWEQDPALLSSFERLLCLKYSQQSIRVKLCPNQACGKAVYMNSVIDSTVVCACGTEVCRHCGAEGHWPLNCLDLRSWNEMMNGREDQWINGLVVQKCPMCREIIEKNNGCIHMTCRCKYQFCWICLKIWKGHGNYYACSDLSRDDHEKKLKEEQAKRKLDQNLYSERLEEARGETERLSLSIKRLNETPIDKLAKRLEEAHVLSIHSDLLKEMKDFIKKAWALVYRSSICQFFEAENALDLKRVIFRINKAANLMDDFMADVLSAKFKEHDQLIAKRVGNNEGSEKDITEAERINLKFMFLKEREAYSFQIREGLKAIELVKRGEIRQALIELTNQNSPLYVDKEPLNLIPKKKQGQIELEEDSSV